MRTVLAASLILVTIIAAACGSPGHHVTNVSAAPYPEGPGPVVASANPKPGEITLSRIAASIPRTFPVNPPQHCNIGAIVRVTFNDGKSLAYGPCVRPREIERLRAALITASRNPAPAAHYWTTQPGTVPTTVWQ